MTNEYGRLEAGAAYDYFRGWSINSSWSLNVIKNASDRSINPSKGFSIKALIDLEKNDFIEGLNLSDSGTLLEEFKPNDLARFQINGTYHYELPWKKRWTISLKGHAGWINKQQVAPFAVFATIDSEPHFRALDGKLVYEMLSNLI